MKMVIRNIALCIFMLVVESLSAKRSPYLLIDSAQEFKSDTVFVSIHRLSFAQIGRLSQSVDVSPQGALLTQDLISTGAFFKQYGISGSATISKRGADATQTQVLWNGLPMNHPMLGMTDFNNFSTFGLSELTYIDGGNSAMYGSGSVGGTVLMNHEAEFGKGRILNLSAAAGSFANRQWGISIGHSAKKSVVQFSHSRTQNNNEFQYFDKGFDERRTAVNSDFSQNISRLLFINKVSKFSQIKTVLEAANMDRGLGMLSGSFNTLGRQLDESFRGVLDYKFQKGKIAFVQKIGGSQDRIVYTQSGLPDTSFAQLRFAMSEFYWSMDSRTQLTTGFDFQQQSGNTRYYSTTQMRNLPAQFLAVRQKRYRTQWLANFRWEWNEKIASGGIGQETHLFRGWMLKSDLHSSFRRATLNDLYWAQPGNHILKNETGWEIEAGWVKKWHKYLKWEFTAFYRELNNPIIWMPAGGQWSARNYHFGRYYGFQNRWQFQSPKFFMNLNTDWVRTRVQAYESSDLMQQIFIPDLMYHLQAGWKHKNWFISSDLTHTGNRFIQTDNEKLLKSYRLIGIQLKYVHKLKYSATLGIQNLLNQEYENMPGRPMPGRSIQIQMNIKL